MEGIKEKVLFHVAQGLVATQHELLAIETLLYSGLTIDPF